jgi:hypothetical protein
MPGQSVYINYHTDRHNLTRIQSGQILFQWSFSQIYIDLNLLAPEFYI